MGNSESSETNNTTNVQNNTTINQTNYAFFGMDNSTGTPNPILTAGFERGVKQLETYRTEAASAPDEGRIEMKDKNEWVIQCQMTNKENLSWHSPFPLPALSYLSCSAHLCSALFRCQDSPSTKANEGVHSRKFACRHVCWSDDTSLSTTKQV